MSDVASGPGSEVASPSSAVGEPTQERLSSPIAEEQPEGDNISEGGNGDDDDNVAGPGKGRARKARKDDDEDDSGAASEEELLSDVDEDQFEDYDPATAYIEERPITIDEEAARGLKSVKRKRPAGEGETRKPREGRREKKQRPGEGGDGTAAGDSGDQNGGGSLSKRQRKPRSSETITRRKKSPVPEVNDEDLPPEERRRRALEKAIDLAIRNPNKRRRKQDEEDLEKAADEEIAQLKIKMEEACMADINARTDGRPAISKLRLLPQVLSVLNRNDIQETVLDPETNFLQSVKFFLEPLNDGSLPSYTIQRDIFTCLTKLPIEKDALLSSGIGKVVLFYTRSKRAEASIKRMAERLVGEWSRPILKKTDDFKKRHVETREFDYRAAKLAEQAPMSQYTLTERPMSRFELDKEAQLAPPVVNPNRARPVGLPQSYTIAPKSTFEGYRGGADYRPIGANSVEAFRKMTQKAKQRNKKK